MTQNAIAFEAELMDVLLNLRHHPNGCVTATFIDGAGNKAVMRLSPQAARDLRDELMDLEDEEN